MIDYRSLEKRIADTLALGRRPVAVAFRERPPSGVPKFTGSEPSGCSFWRLAMGGRVFYTVAADHYNCAVGSHTHNIPLPAERAQELPQTLTFMSGLGYIKMEEVPGIPQLPRTPGAIVYAPLGDTPVDPDVVLFVGRPGRVMLLQEAAQRAGVGRPRAIPRRPTCMALPAAWPAVPSPARLHRETGPTPTSPTTSSTSPVRARISRVSWTRSRRSRRRTPRLSDYPVSDAGPSRPSSVGGPDMAPTPPTLVASRQSRAAPR